MSKCLGLIGFPLGHSFSKKYFSQKFEKENLQQWVYHLFELPQLEEFPKLLAQYPCLVGLNVTIPYKQTIIPYLDELDNSAQKVGAVNVIKILPDGKKIGYNSDYYGFMQSLQNTNWDLQHKKALVLGTGGSAKAVTVALDSLNISYQKISRQATENTLSYNQLQASMMADYALIINTTPLGMYPNLDSFPPIPYHAINSQHHCFDLVYNPEKSLFLQKSAAQGAKIKNGLEMLYLQAEKSWEIWQETD